MKFSFALVGAAAALAASATPVQKRAGQYGNVLYWGGIDKLDQRMSTYCEDGSGVDVIVMSFLSTVGNGKTPQGYIGTECTINEDGNGEGCENLIADIKTCKAKGKKVFVSIGGAGAEYLLTSKADAEGVAYTLWNSWAAPNAVAAGTPRPIGDQFVDGWDFDIEDHPGNSAALLPDTVNKLRSYFAQDTEHSYEISGAPQCHLPEANMGDAVKKSKFDRLFIQCDPLTMDAVYNNDDCSAYQSFRNDGGSFNYDQWLDYLSGGPSAQAKLYIGLPASKAASTDDDSGSKYYLTTQELPQLVNEYKSHANFGGVMLWEAGYVGHTVNSCTYAQQVRRVLDTGSAC